ncbi:hypothetical protein [Haloarchaeobius iranensis]|uniref:Uncharacterized protein n=1 Tax=Haloarchaeobius iranensis TaxID=996166 RepID=A0A1G9SLL6_9EURY|nr:hypothetical protein [Haloarchaeobius iranensis]SDM36374.1 hypothetical protein SAMN05192554_101258 [Haloarchaeobius iranensis]
MSVLTDWLLVGGLVVASVLVLVRSELVRQRRGVSPERRRALAVFQAGSALFVVTMVAFENGLGLLSNLGVHPAVHAVALLVAAGCTLYGFVRIRTTDRTPTTPG